MFIDGVLHLTKYSLGIKESSFLVIMQTVSFIYERDPREFLASHT